MVCMLLALLLLCYCCINMVCASGTIFIINNNNNNSNNYRVARNRVLADVGKNVLSAVYIKYTWHIAASYTTIQSIHSNNLSVHKCCLWR